MVLRAIASRVFLAVMASQVLTKNAKKRKAAAHTEDAPQPAPFPSNVGLEMQSDDEGEVGEDASDDGEVDEFPEIDAASSSEEEERSEADDEDEDDDDEDEDEEDEEDEEDSVEGSDDEDDLYIFPKAQTVVSDITGQLKKMYPEIEPDYDSDSSTEDVRSSSCIPCDPD